MKIPVVGFDPSLLHWGIAEATLDLTTGILGDPHLSIIEPDRLKEKQIRKNSKDLHEARQLAEAVFLVAKKAKAIFVEVPVGSQSASGMKAYGMCVGILGTMLSQDIQLIEVTASEVKKALTGGIHASKAQMIAEALKLYPNSNFPRHTKNGKTFRKGEIMDKAEHAADAIGAIHAGVSTPVFQSLLQLYK